MLSTRSLVQVLNSAFKKQSEVARERTAKTEFARVKDILRALESKYASIYRAT